MEVKDFSIIDMADYINGKKYVSESVHLDVEDSMYQDFADYLAKYEDAAMLFSNVKSHTEFFKYATDFAYWFPKDCWKELFYATKNGFYSKSVPADCIYMIKMAYLNIDLPNLIFRQIPKTWLAEWFKSGYLTDGYTLRDVVCTYCMPQYKPIDGITLKVRYSDYTEIYVPSTDMVAAVPNPIGDILSVDVINQIECNSFGLHVDNHYIRTMGGYYGAVNSNYDLRKLV